MEGKQKLWSWELRPPLVLQGRLWDASFNAVGAHQKWAALVDALTSDLLLGFESRPLQNLFSQPAPRSLFALLSVKRPALARPFIAAYRPLVYVRGRTTAVQPPDDVGINVLPLGLQSREQP